MAGPRYDRPCWFDRTPARRAPAYPRHRGALATEVAVVGGGLTGCTIAWLFAAAGIDVALFERGRLARGTGAVRGLGIVRQEPDADFQDVQAAYGVRAARRIWHETRRASLDFAAALRRLGVRCDLEEHDALWVAATREEEARLRKELRARRDAGLVQDRACWLTAAALGRELRIEGAGGIKVRGVGQLDPYRAAIGLARAAARRGARLFERSPVVRVRAGRKRVELRTAGGVVTAERVVIATGAPTAEYRALRRHFRLFHTYLVLTERLPAPVRRELLPRSAILRDASEPPHFLRWLDDERVLFAGADQPAVADRARPRVLVQRTGQLMYELSLKYPAISGLPAAAGWDAAYARARDGLPCIGAHRNYPRHLFALGHGRHETGLAFLAARLLLRAHRGEPERGDEVFGFARFL
jgi:glycine/D-amino acid oxidase-like deaminating enzyme